MAELVASAVVGETVTRVSGFIIDKKPCERDDVERLEMAHIKMDAALEMSNRWQITDAPVLRWRSKLKRAAQECDETLRHCKQRALEDEELRKVASRSSIPKRIAHAAKSVVSSFISFGKDDPNSSSSVNVRRFERFAEGAGEFLKFVEFGATPQQPMFFDPLIGRLLAGKTARYQALRGGRSYFLALRSTSFADRGVKAMAGFVFQDFREPTRSFSSRFMLRLSESSDVFGIIARFVQSVTPHLKIAAEGLKRELVQLPTQDFSWVESSPSKEAEYWLDVHRTSTQWLRPDPLCCSGHQQHDLITCTSTCSSSKSDKQLSSISRLACIFPEQVIAVHLQCHISPPAQIKTQLNSASQHGRRRPNSLNSGSAPLKLAVLFIPHDFPEGIEPQDESFAFEVIDGKEQEMVHRNATLQDVDEKLLPKAIDHLYQNSESRMYQMCLRSRHGTAALCVEKTTSATRVPSKGRCKTAGSQSHVGNNRRMDKKRDDYRIKGWQEASRETCSIYGLFVRLISCTFHSGPGLLSPLLRANLSVLKPVVRVVSFPDHLPNFKFLFIGHFLKDKSPFKNMLIVACTQ